MDSTQLDVDVDECGEVSVKKEKYRGDFPTPRSSSLILFLALSHLLNLISYRTCCVEDPKSRVTQSKAKQSDKETLGKRVCGIISNPKTNRQSQPTGDKTMLNR